MPGTENGIIYLFADRIQNGCIGIPVFGNSMCLYGEAAGIIGIVQFIQERCVHDVVRIHDYDHVTFFSFCTQVVHGETERIRFGTLGISSFQYCDGW